MAGLSLSFIFARAKACSGIDGEAKNHDPSSSPDPSCPACWSDKDKKNHMNKKVAGFQQLFQLN
ncbi:hypothetical protein GBA52_007425 [Prunus armeniaca]|nr:hypothetical protein GBA52_007425 [Prunus armeniaca]